jgi:hypothetical protein
MEKSPSTPDYLCYRTGTKLSINGHLDEAFWRNCPQSPQFGDIVDGTPGFYQTHAALGWDDSYLYVAFWIQEPYLRAHQTERDSRIYLENDVEVFIAGQDCYYELEINALGTIYEVFFIPQSKYYERGFDQRADFQFKHHHVDVLGGFQDLGRYNEKHPNPRWAFRDWDFPGLQTAVSLQGTINDDSDVDQGWTVEIAFPWSGFKALFPNRTFPPREGDELKMDFSRFEQLYINGQELDPHPGWTWSPHGKYDSHLLEKFTTIKFSEKELSDITR